MDKLIESISKEIAELSELTQPQEQLKKLYRLKMLADDLKSQIDGQVHEKFCEVVGIEPQPIPIIV